jgi:hypothetical protein
MHLSPFNLQKIKNDLNLKKSLLATMKTELQKAQQIHSQSSQQYPLYDLDLGKFTEKVTQLTDRWQKIDKQIDFRCVGPLPSPGSSRSVVQIPPAVLLSELGACPWPACFLSLVLTILNSLYKRTYSGCRLL